jgi:hypothetical protein
MQFLLMNPKAFSWNQPEAESLKPEADCLHLYPHGFFLPTGIP